MNPALPSLVAALLLTSAITAPTVAAETPAPEPAPAKEQHPLWPVLRLAEDGAQRIRNNVRDYQFLLVKRERRNGRLKPYEFISGKIRHADPKTEAPFSVYLHFEKPSSVAGREVLYLEGRNAGKMLVRRGGRRLAYVTTYLDPESPIALEENRYPVTDIGFLTLIERVSEVMREDLQRGECSVQFFKNAKIGDTVCTRVVVEHPYRRDYFRYHRAVVFIDEQRGLPLAYASYQWPRTPGGKPLLVEEYIYTDVQLNVGLTDSDFSRENPTYGFLPREATVAQD